MFQRAVAGSRYIAILAVSCIALVATAVFLYGIVFTVRLLANIAESGTLDSKVLILAAIELVDLFLIGITLYVIAIGMYELFIDPQLPTLPWLRVKDIDDLKGQVLGMVIVILGILFLGKAVAWDGERDLLGFGAAIALVVAALTYFLSYKSRPGGGAKGD